MNVSIWWKTLRLVYNAAPKLVCFQASLSIATGLLSGASVIILAWTVSQVSQVIVSGDVNVLLLPLLASIFIFILGKIVARASEYCDAVLTDLITNFFTLRVATKASEFELEDFENPETYDQVQIVTREAAERPYQILTGTFGVIQNLVSLVAVVSAVAQWNVFVAVLIVISPVAGVLVSNILGIRLWNVEVSRTNQRRMGQYIIALMTTDKSFKEVKSLSLAPELLYRYRELLTSFFLTDRRIHTRHFFYSSFASLIETFFYGIALYLAIQSSVLAGDVGRLAGYIAGLGSASSAATALLTGMSLLYQNGHFVTTVFNFLDRSAASIVSGTKAVPFSLNKGITFRGVSYTYPGHNQPAIDDLNIHIPAGAKVGIVGKNGAGKTTFVKLLSRLYEPSSGSISIDDIEIQDYDIDSVRRSISVLYQDFNRYELPVRDVVGFGDLKYRNVDDKLWISLNRTAMHDVVWSYPDSLDQQLGRFFDGGIQPSGGQWQRLSISRILLSNAPINIFDEPSASLDPQAEENILKVINEDSYKTRIIITHKYSLIKDADLILVLEKGKVIESGTHEELMNSEGEYKSMYLSQSEGFM